MSCAPRWRAQCSGARRFSGGRTHVADGEKRGGGHVQGEKRDGARGVPRAARGSSSVRARFGRRYGQRHRRHRHGVRQWFGIGCLRAKLRRPELGRNRLQQRRSHDRHERGRWVRGHRIERLQHERSVGHGQLEHDGYGEQRDRFRRRHGRGLTADRRGGTDAFERVSARHRGNRMPEKRTRTSATGSVPPPRPGSSCGKRWSTSGVESTARARRGRRSRSACRRRGAPAFPSRHRAAGR